MPAALRLPSPGVHMRHMSPPLWPYFLVDADTCPWPYGSPPLVAARDTYSHGTGPVCQLTQTRVRYPMGIHPWWTCGTPVPAALVECPSGCGHVSVALWLPSPGVHMGHMSLPLWPRFLVDADTCSRPYGSPPLVAARDTYSRGTGPVS